MLLKNFTPSQVIGSVFGLVVAILALVLLISLNKKTPNIGSARRSLMGLIVMTMFATGFMVGKHMPDLPSSMEEMGASLAALKTKKWTGMEMAGGAAGLAIIILALVLMESLNKTTQT